MISVLNRLQQLNGSKLLCVALLLALVGCGTQKKVATKQTRVSTTPRANQGNNKANSKVEEVKWTIVDPEEVIPIGAPEVVKTKKLGTYSVSLLVPFSGDKAQSAELTSKSAPAYKFISYYAGAKMAAEDSRIGSTVDVNVFDSSSGNLGSITDNPTLRSSDVIVGPYDTGELKEVAEFAKANKITHISPWKSSKSIASNNAYHLQTKPSLTQHYQKMVEDAVKSFPSSELIVIGNSSSSDKKRMDYLAKIAGSLGRNDVTQFVVNEDSLLVGDTAFDSIFVQDKTNVFLLPNWSSNDESFIYGCVRKLRVEKGEAKVIVYGMPKMMDTEKITYDFYNNLNIHIIRSEFVDKTSANYRTLRTRFFNEYNAFPTEDLYEGYDMMSFVLNNLENHGKNFQMKVGRDSNRYLQTSYDIAGVPISSAELADKPSNIKYFENTALSVIEFKDGRFRKKR